MDIRILSHPLTTHQMINIYNKNHQVLQFHCFTMGILLSLRHLRLLKQAVIQQETHLPPHHCQLMAERDFYVIVALKYRMKDINQVKEDVQAAF